MLVSARGVSKGVGVGRWGKGRVLGCEKGGLEGRGEEHARTVPILLRDRYALGVGLRGAEERAAEEGCADKGGGGGEVEGGHGCGREIDVGVKGSVVLCKDGVVCVVGNAR